MLARESVVRDSEFYVAVELGDPARRQRGDALVRRASHVEASWLEDIDGAMGVRQRLFFDEQRQKVRATESRCFFDLPVEGERDASPDPEAARDVLREVLEGRAEQLFASQEKAASLLQRLRFLHDRVPECEIEALGPAQLASLLANHLPPTARLSSLRSTDLCALLRSTLPPRFRGSLDSWAPESLAVPSGNRIRLDYAAAEGPVLAVRVQELFGWRETPRIAGARVPVVLHILGPNYRPVQVTRDLESFWNNTYPQVRKDLRGRYPKHAWPEDPWTASPERRPRRRKS